MKDISLKSLDSLATEYENASEQLAQSFNSEWTDSAHESFFEYVKFVQRISSDLRTISHKAESAKNEMVSIRTDEMIRNAVSLCAEAESI